MKSTSSIHRLWLTAPLFCGCVPAATVTVSTTTAFVAVNSRPIACNTPDVFFQTRQLNPHTP